MTIDRVLLLSTVSLIWMGIISGCDDRPQQIRKPIRYVDPFIGTAKAGNVYPAVGVPFGMTQWTPQTATPKKKGKPPYQYTDSTIQGFRGSHWLSGSATQDYGSLTIMPITGELEVYPKARSSNFDHTQEQGSPSYYKVRLQDYDIDAEVTGTMRAGFMKFSFPKSDSSFIIIDTNAAYEPTTDKTTGDGYIRINPKRQLISGYNPVYRMYQGWGMKAGFSGYFVAKFNKPFQEYGTWSHGKSPKRNAKEANDQPGAFVRIPTNEGESVMVKIGTSFTSIEEAKKNLKNEVPGWDFEQTCKQARRSWNTNLAKIKVKGGSEEQRKNFYTSLYHTLLLPRVFSDASGKYPGFAGDTTIHTAKGHPQYADFSLWDTFRAVHPLFTIIERERENDMIASLISKGEQGDFLPIFPVWNSYTSEMIGDHATSVIADAYMKGLRGFNVQKAYQLMYQNGFKLPGNYRDYVSGKGRRALDAYKRLGYIPLEDSVKEAFHTGEQVSRTLEYAYDDWALAQVAHDLGKAKDYEKLIKRAYNYQNVFDTSTGFVRGRYMNGSWIEPFDSLDMKSGYITEGTPWQYTWSVPHDVAGLIMLMGKEQFVARLEDSFERAQAVHPGFRENPYYWHGNEPGHHVAYLFNYAGAPWKTQKWVREILDRSYKATPGGLSGNDDAGQMSAWYVFSALGFYPVSPGRPSYVIGSPIFDESTIKVGKGKNFTVKAIHNSNKNKYIQSATLNGEKWTKPWITHSAIEAGGTLILTMGSSPNKMWGSASSSVPPSMTNAK